MHKERTTPYHQKEKSNCGVGFLVSLKRERSHKVLQKSLNALRCVEHRGGTDVDNHTGDGAGIMTSIPFELLGMEKETFAVASLFAPKEDKLHKKSIFIFEKTFNQFGFEIMGYRDVPIDKSAISPASLSNMPEVVHAFVKRPDHCRTLASFEKLLYMAKQMTMTAQEEAGVHKQFFFTSLSSRTIVYKALSRGEDLSKIYLDLQNPEFKTNFAVFHRRFSTNTKSSWDKCQPFRLIAHNGEINTIEGNRSWNITREKAIGLRKNELITHEGVSDSGNLNGIVEALRNRSCIPRTSEILSILMPPAIDGGSYYDFWSRGMEPWDGPALVTFCDGKSIGARLDRNGLRPCRWTKTKDYFYLCSETGTFDIDSEDVVEKGALYSGSSVNINVLSGNLTFRDSSKLPENEDAFFESNLESFEYRPPNKEYRGHLHNLGLFNYSKEDLEIFIEKAIAEEKEPIGSMGDTARLAFLSDQPRSIFDYFYQDFAQVTNPPLDYIREKSVTDMRVYIGRKPNIFEPKEFIPPKFSLVLDGPVLSLGQLEYLKNNDSGKKSIKSVVIDTTFPKDANLEVFMGRLDEITNQSIEAVKFGATIVILSDRFANKEMIPIPSILALRLVSLGLNSSGRRLRTSVIVDSGDIKNSHHVACLVGFGATAVCPYLLLERAYYGNNKALQDIFPKEREKRIISVLRGGVLRIMAKMGISVLRSYSGSQLFTLLGFGEDILKNFFPRKSQLIGGLSIDELLQKIKKDASLDFDNRKSFLFKEHPTEKMGEVHTLTSKKSRIIHQLVEEDCPDKRKDLFDQFKESIEGTSSFLRHLIGFNSSGKLAIDQVESVPDLLKRFGSGGMSFGAISAESQKDLIEAFREINGRCNSGEGGENPYYFTKGLHANVKQLASGRFGVTCEYLVTGDEVQIKIAQGAKPGEGGQLMGSKVTKEIAAARFATPGVDLISPPPQHDIYSIEDLKQLIYELKELKPELKVSVKLVSGKNIGAIAVGVVKAGADIIQISGGDGGTGAASLLSMKHAGLPLETGLIEVHHSLVESGMRDKVTLRADGGLLTGKDLLLAAILGADEFDFGKIVLVAEGCIMARICEKNTCPTGIATHDLKFKAKYKGNKDKVVTFLKQLAIDLQLELAETGYKSLLDLRGRTEVLILNPKVEKFAKEKGFDISYFTGLNSPHDSILRKENILPNSLNQKVVNAVNTGEKLEFTIRNTDRAIPASLAGLYGSRLAKQKLNKDFITWNKVQIDAHQFLKFNGSAGQGFGIFLSSDLSIHLEGEANDSVGKGLCGGEIVITPPPRSKFDPSTNSIIGNCALYGATSGRLFVHGKGGDRFAVRNSGANAVIEGVGIHACEYMTGGTVIILGQSLGNIGAGMTGGEIFLHKDQKRKINEEYIKHIPFREEDFAFITNQLRDYINKTDSAKAKRIFQEISVGEFPLLKFVPV